MQGSDADDGPRSSRALREWRAVGVRALGHVICKDRRTGRGVLRSRRWKGITDANSQGNNHRWVAERAWRVADK